MHQRMVNKISVLRLEKHHLVITCGVGWQSIEVIDARVACLSACTGILPAAHPLCVVLLVASSRIASSTVLSEPWMRWPYVVTKLPE